jgi:xanthine dehydrogenase large subunit
MDDGGERREAMLRIMGAALAHDSAHKHVSGAAIYTDDLPEPPGLLHAWCIMSPHAHARIVSIDLSAVRAHPGVVAAISAADIPGKNDVAPAFTDEPALAEGAVEYIGQPVAAIAAASIKIARAAGKLAKIVYEPREPVLTIEAALEREFYVSPPVAMDRGDAAAALAAAPRRLSGEFRCGGQDHFYLEGQIALAIPQEDGDMLVHSSTQHPSEVQKLVAQVLGKPINAVTVEVRRMGGGFGGKETQPANIAAIAATLAHHARRPVKYRLDRDDDMLITGKRHDFLCRYQVGFDDDGRLLAVDATLACRAGHVADLSAAILDRAVFHAVNCYYVPHVRLRGYACKTHTQSNTAFRGFGGPQGMLLAEHMIDEVARATGRDAASLRVLNLYGKTERNVTPYRMPVEDNILPELLDDLMASAEYAQRRAAIDEFNRASPILKKGLALTPVMFGISFTTTFLNQAGALVHVYSDGSVHLNHGGTEMGQGLMIKVAQIVADEFQVPIDRVKITATNTGKVPNTSPTAASSGTDMNGAAARIAARAIRDRLAALAAEIFKAPVEQVRFAGGHVHAGAQSLAFGDLAHRAWLARVSLSATGYYRTPKISWDKKTGTGRPFFYFAYGAGVAEALLDTLTGEYKITRFDALHDVGRSLNEAIDLGQIEGGIIQGIGWLTSEELWFDPAGMLKTHAPSTYKIPVASDLPRDWRIRIMQGVENREDTVFRAKAVGEPPLMLANAAFFAIKDAIAAAVGHRVAPKLDAPATPERVLLAIAEAGARAGIDPFVNPPATAPARAAE